MVQKRATELTMVRTSVEFRYSDVFLAGIIGGIVFALFEMVAGAALVGPQGWFMPLRMIGAIILGPPALDPRYSLSVAVLFGVTLHLLVSVVFAAIFAAFVSPTWSTGALTVAGIIFGTVVWLVNFHLVAPLAGWTWFADRSEPLVELLAHAFFYGCPVGWYLGRFSARIAVRNG
jgi:hypothetical protein